MSLFRDKKTGDLHEIVAIDVLATSKACAGARCVMYRKVSAHGALLVKEIGEFRSEFEHADAAAQPARPVAAVKRCPARSRP